MKKNGKTKMIGYTPSQTEQEKISYIAEVFGLTNTGVIKALFYNNMTLNEYYEHAKENDKNNPNQTGGEKEMVFI